MESQNLESHITRKSGKSTDNLGSHESLLDLENQVKQKIPRKNELTIEKRSRYNVLALERPDKRYLNLNKIRLDTIRMQSNT